NPLTWRPREARSRGTSGASHRPLPSPICPAHQQGPAPPSPPKAAKQTAARLGAALRQSPAAAQPPKPVWEAARLRQQPSVTLCSAAEGGRLPGRPDADGGLRTVGHWVAELHAAACAAGHLTYGDPASSTWCSQSSPTWREVTVSALPADTVHMVKSMLKIHLKRNNSIHIFMF
ncbi:hypothetical protein MC885_017777, partial [Smutsia gigantea]